MLGHSNGSTSMMVVKAGPLVQRATGFRQIWKHSKGSKDYDIYIPTHEDDDFLALGCFCVFGSPSAKGRPDPVVPAAVVLGRGVWSDRRTGCKYDISLAMVPEVGTFWPSRATLNNPGKAHKIKSDTLDTEAVPTPPPIPAAPTEAMPTPAPMPAAPTQETALEKALAPPGCVDGTREWKSGLFQEQSLQFRDRNYKLKGVPSYLLNSSLFSGPCHCKGGDAIKISINRPAVRVYVLVAYGNGKSICDKMEQLLSHAAGWDHEAESEMRTESFNKIGFHIFSKLITEEWQLTLNTGVEMSIALKEDEDTLQDKHSTAAVGRLLLGEALDASAQVVAPQHSTTDPSNSPRKEAAVSQWQDLPQQMAPLNWNAGLMGDFIEINGKDGFTTATDTAKKGNTTGGRYRPIVAEQGFSQGSHSFVFKLEKPGRVLLGVCTEKVTGESREVHKLADAWSICLNSDCSGKQNLWNNHTSTPTSLPGVPVGGELVVMLDCDAHTLKFKTQGIVSPSMTCLQAGVKLYPFAAFGGDKTEGCVVSIRDEAAGESPNKKQT